MDNIERTSNIVLNRLEGTVIATVQSDLTESTLSDFREKLLSSLDKGNASYLIIDFMGLDLMDVSEFNEIRNIMRMAALMGTDSICAGLSPGIVSTLVQFGANVDGLKTALNLGDAFNRIKELNKA